ncbi:MAG: class I SAM-dependent DNA methyltransferase [Aggregatilineales bacterium]
MTQSAFDALAPTYDDDYSNTLIGQYLRQRVQTRLMLHFSAGDSVLEMGCGTGEDAYFLGEQGIHILATDVSEKMLAITDEKTVTLNTVTTAHLDLNNLSDDFSSGKDDEKFDGAFANAGVLNCVSDYGRLAKWLAARLRPGAVFAAGVMSPFCIWELLWHGLHLDFSVATRRWRKSTFQPDDTVAPIVIDYPTINHLKQALSPFFTPAKVMPLGLFLPPSDVFAVIEKRSRLLKRLTTLENQFQNWQGLSHFADHYWIEFERTTHPICQ